MKSLHPRNRHNRPYDFAELVKKEPELKSFVIKNKLGADTIDFANPVGVKTLNRALLKTYYNIDFWDIPEGFLCPPIPGRVDYIHHLAELIGTRKKVKVLDIGVGANCIYPLVGHAEYGWDFVGSEINQVALESAKKIVKMNSLSGSIDIRYQMNRDLIFRGVIRSEDRFDLTMCNPPFHESQKTAKQGNARKWRNLGEKPGVLNFGGKSNELWYPGGEKAFLKMMIVESFQIAQQVGWFTSLVSKEENLKPLEATLKQMKASTIEVINMSHGQKKSRVLAWQID